MKCRGYDSCTSWLVAIGICIINSLTLTPYRLAGLMYVELVERYDTDREKASIPVILFLLVRCVGGPFYGLLGEKFGLEEVTLLGSFLAAVGFGGCFFARNIIDVIFLLGIVYGIGMALSNVLLASIVKKHFTENMNTANGIAQAGSCLGAFIVPPAAIYFLNTYGTSGTFLIISAIMLHAVPLSMLVRGASVVQTKLILCQSQRSKNYLKQKDGEYDAQLLPCTKAIAAECSVLKKSTLYSLNNCSTNPSNEKQEKIDSNTLQRLRTKPSLITSNNNVQLTVTDSLLLEVETESTLPACVQGQYNDAKQTDAPKFSTIIEHSIVSSEKPSNATVPVDLPNTKKRNFFYSFSVLKEPSYIIIMLCSGLNTYVTTLFWTTTIDYSRDKGISKEKEIYFLMLQPLLDMIGRLCFGWVTDLGYLTLQTYSILCYGLMALSIGSVLWSSSFGMMISGALLFSLCSGALVAVFPGMIFKCVDKDKQAVGIASRHLFYGFLAFSSSPLIGYFREDLGSYDGLFYLFIVLCLLCCVMIPFMFRFSKHVRDTMSK